MVRIYVIHQEVCRVYTWFLEIIKWEKQERVLGFYERARTNVLKTRTNCENRERTLHMNNVNQHVCTGVLYIF